MLKRLLFRHLFFLVLMALLCGACHTSGNKNDKHSIAVVVSTLNNPWFVFLAEKAAEKARALGYNVKVFDSQNNTALESDHFDNIIVAGFDAILFNSTDANGSVANIVRAKAAGIPVFCMDREVSSLEAPASQILSDSYAGAVAIGKYFTQQLHKGGRYVELLGLVGDNNTWARSKGFHSVVDNYPGLIMVAQQTAEFDRNKAMEVMESVLQAHPDIQAVFCGNDAMASGAFQALVSAGKTGSVKVFGFDGAADVITSISENKIAATGMQFPEVMAETAALFADQYIKGKRDFPKKVPVAVELVTAKNINGYTAFGKK